MADDHLLKITSEASTSTPALTHATTLTCKFAMELPHRGGNCLIQSESADSCPEIARRE